MVWWQGFLQIGICEGLLMSNAKKAFQAYLDKEAKAVEAFKEEMKKLEEQYKAILEKEKKV